MSGYEYLNLSLVCDTSDNYDDFVNCVDENTFRIEDIIEATIQVFNYNEDFNIRSTF